MGESRLTGARCGVPSAGTLEAVLWRHVLEPWFPRCVDREHGGFICDFDAAWRPSGPQHKLLEFQARQTLAAALAAKRYPEAWVLRDAACHGFRGLSEIMWDDRDGGWFHLTDRAGHPLEGETKHAHGFAYAIEACVAVHALTRDPAALALAREGFTWLDRGAHDAVHGGYLGFLDRGGRPIDTRGSGWDGAVDTIGTPLGCKDVNVFTDMIRALSPLTAAWPGGPAETRRAELVELLVDRLVEPDDRLALIWTRDWSPRAGAEHIGYYFQAASHLVEASSDARVHGVARRLVERGFARGWDKRGGGLFELRPTRRIRPRRSRRTKIWWPQWEALLALAAVGGSAWEGTDGSRFARLWEYVLDQVVDEERGGCGWFCRDSRIAPLAHGGPAFATAAESPKGSAWKDASHEVRCLLHCIAKLERPGAGPPSSVAAAAP